MAPSWPSSAQPRSQSRQSQAVAKPWLVGNGVVSRPAVGRRADHAATRGRIAPLRQGRTPARPPPRPARGEDVEVRQRTLLLAEWEAIATDVRPRMVGRLTRKHVSRSPSGRKMRRLSSWPSVSPLAASASRPVPVETQETRTGAAGRTPSHRAGADRRPVDRALQRANQPTHD